MTRWNIELGRTRPPPYFEQSPPATVAPHPLMKLHFLLFLIFAAFPAFPAFPAFAQDEIPKGELTSSTFTNSTIFPGTERSIWVYVPKQYTGDKPACVAAFCDGSAYTNPKRGNYAPAIFDRLIASGEMPVTIGVFVNPGVLPAANENALPRFNRSYEYDGLGDDYARFLDTELLPHLATKYDLKFSDDPNDRLVGGASSGGICAFNAAWSRPDRFRRVWCTVGTFVGLRGGDELHSLVRKTEAKPLRIFLHDGSNDLNIYAGDWWMANQQMQRALQWMGYEHTHLWDETKHGRAGENIHLEDAMKYLWKDWPAKITTHPENAAKRRATFTIPGEDWRLVSFHHGFTEGPAADKNGNVFFTDIPNSVITKHTAAGKNNVFAKNTGKANGLMIHPDGRLFACRNGKQEIVAYYTDDGSHETIVKDVNSNDLCIRADGTVYFSSPRAQKIFRIKPGAKTADPVADAPGCNGVLLSPDQTQLYVTNFRGRMVSVFQVQADGSLAHGQPYYWLHLPPRSEVSSLDGMTVDSEGWLYVATKLGVQICDQAGRVNFILPPPPGARHPSNVCFGGENHDHLFITCGDKVFKRKLSKTGVRSWQAVAPKKPRL